MIWESRIYKGKQLLRTKLAVNQIELHHEWEQGGKSILNGMTVYICFDCCCYMLSMTYPKDRHCIMFVYLFYPLYVLMGLLFSSRKEYTTPSTVVLVGRRQVVCEWEIFYRQAQNSKPKHKIVVGCISSWNSASKTCKTNVAKGVWSLSNSKWKIASFENAVELPKII